MRSMSMLIKKDSQDVVITSDIFVILGIVSFLLTQPTAFGEKLNILASEEYYHRQLVMRLLDGKNTR